MENRLSPHVLWPTVRVLGREEAGQGEGRRWQTLGGKIYTEPFWYPKELSYMKVLGKVVAVNPWKVREECTARRK